MIRGQAPPGWRFAMPQAAQLATAGMLHGPPEESGYLAPAESKSTKSGSNSGWTQRWQFDRPHWYQTFAYCAYGGDRGPLQLFFPIDPDAAECKLTGSRKADAVERIVFVCR